MTDTPEELADSGRLERLAAAVASGQTVRSAAESIGVPERSAYRTSGSEEFKKRVAELRTEATFAAVGVLNTNAARAAAVMVELLGDEHTPRDRLAAAKTIMNALMPLAEHSELRERLAALEQQR